MKKFELMAPAGNFSSLKTALNAGADSVYFGLPYFSMRSGKNNFKISDLKKIKKIIDSYKAKAYLTLNTIVYDSELKKLEEIVKKAKGNIDAIICWDMAVINLCKKYKVPFFISTQASIANKESLNFYQKLGAKRVVLARELNLKQIKKIIIPGMDIEVFVHGAMCVSISGRCFISQFLFNKSANRGECFHPCRRSYIVKEEKYNNQLKIENNKVMSAKDLCILPFIEELKKIGVKAFKIEGRNRDERYIDRTVRVYKKALEKKLKREEVIELMKELESVYNRGFSSGFYLGKPTPKDFSEVENSASNVYREFLGKVLHYYPKAGALTIKLSNRVKKGDEIIIIDDEGIKEIKIEEMEIEKKRVSSGKKGDLLGINVPFKVSKGVEIYKLKKRKL